MNINKIKFFLKVFLKKELYFPKQIKVASVKLGSSYGGWKICPTSIGNKSIVYSFGIGDDISWDLEMIKEFGCAVYAFDPSPKSAFFIKSQSIPSKLIVQFCGIASKNGDILLYPPENENHVSYSVHNISNKIPIKFPVKCLASIMQEYRHTKIDILKMDIEGAEYDVLENILSEKIDITQILIEFHHRFVGIGNQKTINAVKLLNKYNYKIFAISDSGLEYSFIRVHE